MISVVIVNWNSGNLLESCVRSLLNNAGECQILIVDNASSDASLQLAAGLSPDIAILKNKQNIGFAAANNLGWRASTGTRILFLNPDTECLPGSIERLDQTLAADKAIWAAGGHLIGASGRSQEGFNVRPFPSVAGVAAEMLFLDKIRRPRPVSCAAGAASGMLAVDVDQPAAACLMVNREALEKIGGFDEAFGPAWFEDVDLCRRIRDHGGRIQYQPEARFRHLGGYSLNRLSRQSFLVTFHLNQIRYFRKHHGPRAAARVKRLIIWGLRLRSALSLVYPPATGEPRISLAKTFWDAARYVGEQSEVQL